MDSIRRFATVGPIDSAAGIFIELTNAENTINNVKAGLAQYMAEPRWSGAEWIASLMAGAGERLPP